MKNTIKSIAMNTPQHSHNSSSATMRLSSSYNPSSSILTQQTSSQLSTSSSSSSSSGGISHIVNGHSNSAIIAKPKKSLLSSSVQNTSSPLSIMTSPPSGSSVTTPAHSYRNIKAKYFSSLNLSSPIKTRLMEQQQMEALEQTNSSNNNNNNNNNEDIPTRTIRSTSIPIPTRPHTKSEPIPMPGRGLSMRRSSNGDEEEEEDDDDYNNDKTYNDTKRVRRGATTQPVAMNINSRGARRQLVTTYETPIDNTFNDAFLFGGMDGQSLRTRRDDKYAFTGKFEVNEDEDEEEPEDNDLLFKNDDHLEADEEDGVTTGHNKQRFLPPHLLTNRSDFSLYKHERKVQMQKKIKNLL